MRRRSYVHLYSAAALTCTALFLAHLTFHAVEALEAAIVPIRLNVGGETTTDAQGNVWESDDSKKYINTGNVVWACPRAISNTENDFVYCTYRWFNQVGTPYRYTFPQVTPGEYIIRLHFAELFFKAANRRVFDIYVDGSLFLNDYDIFQQAGSHNKANIVHRIINVTHNNGLNVELVAVKENPSINGIEIIPNNGNFTTGIATMAPSIAPTLAPIAATDPVQGVVRINAGGDDYIDSFGNTWAADKYVVNFHGQEYTDCHQPISSTVDDTLYCCHRWFAPWTGSPYVYSIPVITAGVYEVRLHFAEIYFDTIGKRVFDVLIEGIVVAAGVDVVALTAGKNIAYVLTLPAISISDGTVSIELVAEVENPFIAAIEIIPPKPKAPNTFQPILINCGGDEYLENSGVRTWKADQYYTDGFTYSNSFQDISGTLDDAIYQGERWGEFSYEIPVPTGQYEITIHLVEIFFQKSGSRVFDLTIEGKTFYSVDIISIAGEPNKAVTLQTAQIIDDGFISIKVFKNETTSLDNPKLSAIEVKHLAPHTAHAVGGGPYVAVDTSNRGFAIFLVDGSASHTHGPGLVINQYIWKKGANLLGTGATANLQLPVGEHSVVLTIVDSGGNDSSETFKVSILPYGYPAIFTLSPSNGTINGGQLITITGSGFNFTAAQTVVTFGLVNLTVDMIEVVNDRTINVISPRAVIATPVPVSVTTPIGTSDKVTFKYIASSEIVFESGKLVDIQSATVAKFGPDRKLYVGTFYGQLHKITLNADFTTVTAMATSTVAQYKSILGIAFDPLDVGNPNPPVYVTSSFFFHGESMSTSGNAINGKIHRVTGANMDVVEDIITGLPVSDSDHGVSGIVFGNEGELYIQIGSNTNGGIPGPLTTKQTQKDSYYSSATVVAELSDPNFDGAIKYDAVDDGTPNGGYGISVFAPGNRNPYGIVLHSNGYLYGTDNGPNLPYGNMMTGCNPGKFIAAVETADKINLLQKGKFYGQPNAKRAAVDNDPRQCVWQHPSTPTSANFTGPLLMMKSSTNGIIEYEADSFDGQLRGNLIASKYTDGLFRVVLTEDGLNVVPESLQALPLVGDWGLDVAMAPNGNLIEVRLPSNALYYHKPVEQISTKLQITSVFPTRGSNAGGSILFIYGRNLNSGANVTVLIGDKNCRVDSTSNALVSCVLPGGAIGRVDVTMSSDAGFYVFKQGYRYISGFR